MQLGKYFSEWPILLRESRGCCAGAPLPERVHGNLQAAQSPPVINRNASPLFFNERVQHATFIWGRVAYFQRFCLSLLFMVRQITQSSFSFMSSSVDGTLSCELHYASKHISNNIKKKRIPLMVVFLSFHLHHTNSEELSFIFYSV